MAPRPQSHGQLRRSCHPQEHCPWPSSQWWRLNIVHGVFVPAGFGRISPNNTGGGWWQKPPLPQPESDEERALVAKLDKWNTSLAEYVRQIPLEPVAEEPGQPSESGRGRKRRRAA